MDVKLPNGKTIKGVPEGTSKDEIRDKAIQAGLATPEDFGQTAEQSFQPMQQQGAEPERGLIERAGQAIGGAVSGVQEMFTGEQRTGPDIERTPSLFEGDFLADLSAADKAKIVGLAQVTSDPQELAEIVKAQVPDTEIQYNKDEQGNVYPVLRRTDGRAAMVDKPGMDMLNLAQMGADMAMFTPAGRAGTIARGVAGATGTEAARQGVQASAGGEFDETQVALAGGMEGAGRAVERGVGALYRGMAGKPTQAADEIIEAGERYGIPVMTSDVVPPTTPAGRAAQMVPESVPLVGTGGLRSSQQASRERATDQFIERFQGGGYDTIVKSLQDQKSRIQKAAGNTYSRLVPKLDNAVAETGGIPFENTQKAIEEAREVFTRSGRKTSDKALDVLADIQETAGVSDQSFQTLKDNIGAWQEAVDSVDPAIRSQLTSKDTAQIKKVLSALRKDRDAFAEAALSPNEYRQLKNADAAYGEMANTLKKSRIKSVLDKGDTTPEVAKNLLFSSKPSEIRTLYQGLTNEGRENARATIIGEIADRLSRRASGLTPDALATELGRSKETLDVFFRGNRRKELNGFIRLLNATRRAQKSGGTFSQPTGQQAIPYLVGAGSVIEPNVAAAYGTVGALGRLYESPRVRGIMARLASVEPGSTRFEQLVQQYGAEARRLAQAARDEEIPENLGTEEDQQ